MTGNCPDCGFELREDFEGALVCGRCLSIDAVERVIAEREASRRRLYGATHLTGGSGSSELGQDIEYLRKRVAELLDDGKEWFGHEADPVEWTNPKYGHQN